MGERNLAEIDRVVADHIHARDALEAVSREDLIEFMRDGLVTILDVNRLEQRSEYVPLR